MKPTVGEETYRQYFARRVVTPNPGEWLDDVIPDAYGAFVAQMLASVWGKK